MSTYFKEVHWSIGLVLKAYMHVRGWTDARRPAEVRHDIAVALAVSERDGLEGVDDLSRPLAETLSHF